MAHGKDLHSRRSALYHAAEESFRLHGLKRTTVEDICRAAAVSKASFYELFADKYELLRLLEQKRLADALAEWRRATASLSAGAILLWYADWLQNEALLPECLHLAGALSPGPGLRMARRPVVEELARQFAEDPEAKAAQCLLDSIEARVLLHGDSPLSSDERDDFHHLCTHFTPRSRSKR